MAKVFNFCKDAATVSHIAAYCIFGGRYPDEFAVGSGVLD